MCALGPCRCHSHSAIDRYFYYTLSVGYVKTGRDLRRMESNTRSPIFSGFAELLDGIVTVRAFSAERLFFDNMHSRVCHVIPLEEMTFAHNYY